MHSSIEVEHLLGEISKETEMTAELLRRLNNAYFSIRIKSAQEVKGE